ncbi:MAG: hypothetical protein AB2552_01570 [Candidatus Thiodiazotropha endolucinida]
MKNSLLKSFNPDRERDIEKAIELANYLTSLKEYEQAQKYLDSFIYLNPKEKAEDLWVHNAQGVVLLLYICRVTNQENLCDKYRGLLEEHDMWPADIGRTRWVKMHISDHNKKVDYALTETHKHKCAILGQEVLSFMYFNEMLFENNRPSLITNLLLRDVRKIFTKSKELLLTALTS